MNIQEIARKLDEEIGKLPHNWPRSVPLKLSILHDSYEHLGLFLKELGTMPERRRPYIEFDNCKSINFRPQYSQHFNDNTEARGSIVNNKRMRAVISIGYPMGFKGPVILSRYEGTNSHGRRAIGNEIEVRAKYWRDVLKEYIIHDSLNGGPLIEDEEWDLYKAHLRKLG